MNIFDALSQRTSVNYFDTERAISTAEVLELLDYAGGAPE
tara:strand:- start:486 stop:605 length:120 start_codon:yes stop_codon:yes gene_type:complete